MKLYGFPPTRSIRALWTLRELDVAFEFVNVDLLKGEQRRPEFLAINPAGKLPVLVDGDFVLTESVAIVLYLADKYPERDSCLPGPDREPRPTAGCSSRRRSSNNLSGGSRGTRRSTRRRSVSPRRSRSPGKISWIWAQSWRSTWRVGSTSSARR